MSSPTSLTTPIPGDPEQVRRLSTQLAAVETRAREIESRLRAIETGVGPQMWRGRAADGFAALLVETGPDVTRLATSYGAASQALATYATELAAAQDAARAAEAEATRAAGDRDRALADRDSAEADAVVHAAAVEEARLRLDPVTAQDAEQRRADTLGRANAAGAAVDEAEQALRAARQKAEQAASQRDAAAARCVRELEDASSAGIGSRNLVQEAVPGQGPLATGVVPRVLNDVGAGARDFGQNLVNDVWDKWYFNATDLVSGAVGGYYGLHRKALQRQAEFLTQQKALFRERYLQAPPGSALARRLTELEFEAANKASELHDRVAKMGGTRGRIIAGKLPVIGLGVTALGAWRDIHNGKPAGKAVISGLSGFGAGIVFGLIVSGPVGWTALGAVGASALVGVGVDMAYDALPKGVQDAIEDGVEATVDGITEGAKSLWDAIF